jgi:hypothetical protein
MTHISINERSGRGNDRATPQVNAPSLGETGSWLGAARVKHVGAKLDSLSRHGFHVLHEVPVGVVDCEIDHLIIGSGGVFTVNTKSHAGHTVKVSDYSITVGGEVVPYLRNAKFEAERAATVLGGQVGFDVPVRGAVVVLTGAFAPEVTYDRRPIGVSVLTKRDVPRWFRRQPAILTAGEVDALANVARQPSVWA